MPDTSDPPPRQAEEHDTPTAAAELGFEEYHHLADQYLERLLGRLEAKQEERPDIDAEYSVSLYTRYWMPLS
jgi:frataxin